MSLPSRGFETEGDSDRALESSEADGLCANVTDAGAFAFGDDVMEEDLSGSCGGTECSLAGGTDGGAGSGWADGGAGSGWVGGGGGGAGAGGIARGGGP